MLIDARRRCEEAYLRGGDGVPVVLPVSRPEEAAGED